MKFLPLFASFFDFKKKYHPMSSRQLVRALTHYVTHCFSFASCIEFPAKSTHILIIFSFVTVPICIMRYDISGKFDLVIYNTSTVLRRFKTRARKKKKKKKKEEKGPFHVFSPSPTLIRPLCERNTFYNSNKRDSTIAHLLKF